MAQNYAPRRNLYADVTDKILAALEAGTLPWACPWDRSGEVSLPINHSTGAFYQGINIPMLWMAQHENGFTSSRWMTYKQAQAQGGQVCKGERGTAIIFYKTLQRDSGRVDHTTGEAVMERIPLLRGFTVFNLDQIDGIDAPLPQAADGGFDPIAVGEAVLQASGVSIRHGGARAYYMPGVDAITLPDRARFAQAADYYATALHELAHATKHASRCNRPRYPHDDGKVSYAFEELVAEMGAAFLMATLGISGDVKDHASYLDGWLTLLRQDTRAIFKASAQAQKAANWVLEKHAGASNSLEQASA
jgi:antirestriction protein ArdC